MRLPWTLGVVLMSITFSTASTSTLENTTDLTSPVFKSSAVTEAQIKERLATINLPLEVDDTDEVVRRINQYVLAGRHETEAILGRTIAFFPVFEHYLELHGLPKELKYLPMIESGLRPTVKSHVGAAGMWQLMGITARHHGLLVNAQVDERFDPYKSTEAAVRMLKYLDGLFDDWALVLSAYNAGPGRVKNAVRYAGSNEYAKVYPHLPRETKRYVPAFVAAAYIANFYHLHQLTPAAPSSFNQDLRILTVQQTLSFNKIAEITELSYRDISAINPAYLKGYIPQNSKGNFLALPATASKKMREYLTKEVKAREQNLVPTLYLVAPGDNLAKIAKMYQTTEEKIRDWNGLGDQPIVLNQELTLLLSRAYLINRA